MLTISVILHPTDFSDSSTYAFRLACSLARDHGARLLVLHVAPSLGPEMVPVGEAMTELEPEAHRAHLWTELRRLHPSDPSTPVEHQLAEGDAATLIAQMAATSHSGLIVMGTHGRTGLRRVLMGSVAEQVMRRAPCPVLTVKSPAPT